MLSAISVGCIVYGATQSIPATLIVSGSLQLLINFIEWGCQLRGTLDYDDISNLLDGASINMSTGSCSLVGGLPEHLACNIKVKIDRNSDKVNRTCPVSNN